MLRKKLNTPSIRSESKTNIENSFYVLIIKQ